MNWFAQSCQRSHFSVVLCQDKKSKKEEEAQKDLKKAEADKKKDKADASDSDAEEIGGDEISDGSFSFENSFSEDDDGSSDGFF